MGHRSWYVGILGAVSIAVGLFVLRFPVLLDQYDSWGWQIDCGTGFAADLSQAAADESGSDVVGACGSALLTRRMWTIPLVAVGTITLILVLIRAALTPRIPSPSGS